MAKRRKMGWRERLMLAALIVAAVVFLPLTVIIFIGMLPSVVARITDKSRERTKVLTVGFMNFAGCFPFLCEVVKGGLKLDHALEILTDPLTIILIYSCAVMGYAIEWLVTSMVASIMVQKGRGRLENIKKIQESMTKQWGAEVSGDLPLDNYGFPIDPNESSRS